MKQERYFLEIWPQDGRYEGSLHRGDAGRGRLLPSLALGAGEAPFPGRKHTLGSLVERLVKLDEEFAGEFDERFQTDLGRYLYAQTFGQIDAWDPPDEGDVEVQIVTEDEHIARLPWVLLNRRGPFLCASGWSVSLTRSAAGQEDCELPPSPRLLVVAPEPSAWTPTHAAAHLEELEETLSAADSHFRRGRHLRVVSSWEELAPALDELQPHLLYYYGHGQGTLNSSRLVFARGAERSPREVPVADFAQLLRRHAGPQLLFAYVNCCQGDAGGILGAGWQLGEIVPAVVTNRTQAYISTARSQALELWRAVLLRGEAPHRAVSTLHARIEDPGLSFRNSRWMNPAVHRRYGHWTANPPRPRLRSEHDPHWGMKLDRVKQFGQVFMEADQMLRERRPRTLAYFWYGEEGQGVELFHQRLQVELRERLDESRMIELRPRWPDELHNPYHSFEEMIAEACEIQDLTDLAAWVRGEAQLDRRRIPLVHIRHEPLRQGEVVKPSTMKTYLEWWDDHLAPSLANAGAFGLLGVSFLAQKNPARLQNLLNETLEDFFPQNLVFHVLDEMEEVVKKDLLDFLQTHNVSLPKPLRDRVLVDILAKTGGRYEMTLEALKALVDQAWDEGGEERAERPASGEDEW